MASFAILNCTSCGRVKSEGESMLVMKGDWLFRHCMKNNFAKRKTCYSCGIGKVVTKHVSKPICDSRTNYLKSNDKLWSSEVKTKSA